MNLYKAGIVSLLSIPWLSAVILLGLISRKQAGFLFRKWAISVSRMIRLKVHLEDRNDGAYHDPPYLFVQLNQTTLIEVICWPQFMPVQARMIENVEFASIPFLGWATVAIGGLPIIRQWRTHAIRSLDRAVIEMRKGGNFAVSIEGRRSRVGSLAPYKKGPVFIAISARATIIPVIFKFDPSFHEVRVVLAEAIGTDGLTHDDRGSLLSRLRVLAESETREGPLSGKES